MNINEIQILICKVRDEAKNKGISASFILHHEYSHLMRIGNSSVSLNTSEALTRLDVTVYKGRKTGTHTQLREILSEKDISEALEIAVKKAETASDAAYILPVPPIPEDITDTNLFDQNLATVDSAYETECFKKIFEAVGTQYDYFGAWSSGSVDILIASTASSHVVRHLGSDMQFNLLLKHPTEKWEIQTNQTGWRLSDFDVNKSIKELKDLLKVYEGSKGIRLEPGKYRIAFGSGAMADVLDMAVGTGFNGGDYEQKQTWTANSSLGDKILSEKVTLTDDPTITDTFGFGFDLTGLKRDPYCLVNKGRMVNMPYDAISAAIYNKKPTGHSLPGFSIAMSPGEDPADVYEAVKDLGTVIYIPMLHYLGLPSIGGGIFTGSSRFNAVLIEDGKVKGPIFSARITDSFANVFGNILKMSKETESYNISQTYERRFPIAFSLPKYIISDNIKITDSSESF